MKKRCLRKIANCVKPRSLAVTAVTVIPAVVATPGLIRYAEAQRGYFAIGGEFLLIPLALALAIVICWGLDIWDEFTDKRN